MSDNVPANPMRLVVGYSAYGGRVHWGHVPLFRQISDLWRSAVGTFPGAVMADSPLLARSRNLVMQRAIVDGDVLLLFDADTWVPSGGDLLRGILEGLDQGAAVVAAAVAQRGRPGLNAGRVAEQDRGDPRGDVERLWPPQPEKLIEVDRVGTAVMAIDLRWMRRTWPWKSARPWFADGYYEVEGVPRTYGEDIGFCAGVRARGGRILVDGRIKSIHQGASDMIMGDTRWEHMAHVSPDAWDGQPDSEDY